MQGLANVLYQLSTLRFSQIESLIISDSSYTLTDCVHNSFQLPYNLSAFQIDSGPFDSSENYYRSLLSIYYVNISNPKSASQFPFLFPLLLQRNYSMEDEFQAAETKYNNPFYLSNNYSSSDINIA